MTVFNDSRRAFFRQWVAAGALAAGSAAAAAAPAAKGGDKDKEEDVPLAKVPTAVRKAAEKAAPKSKWLGATKITQEGEVSYELDGTDAKGREVTVVLDTEGTLLEIEHEISMKDVPKAVTEALKKKLPNFKVTTAHTVTQDGKVVHYSFEGKRPKDQEEIDVTIAADASSVEIDED